MYNPAKLHQSTRNKICPSHTATVKERVVENVGPNSRRFVRKVVLSSWLQILDQVTKDSFIENINTLVDYATEVSSKASYFTYYYILSLLSTTGSTTVDPQSSSNTSAAATDQPSLPSTSATATDQSLSSSSSSIVAPPSVDEVPKTVFTRDCFMAPCKQCKKKQLTPRNKN
jgi:hypothetical protein